MNAGIYICHFFSRVEINKCTFFYRVFFLPAKSRVGTYIRPFKIPFSEPPPLVVKMNIVRYLYFIHIYVIYSSFRFFFFCSRLKLIINNNTALWYVPYGKTPSVLRAIKYQKWNSLVDLWPSIPTNGWIVNQKTWHALSLKIYRASCYPHVFRVRDSRARSHRYVTGMSPVMRAQYTSV